MTKFFHALDNARLAYRDQGAGVPILCLAGLTRGQNDFDALWRAFDGAANGVRFISMDYRGRGASDFTGARTYSVEQEAADALHLLDHLSLPKAAILGTSRGGLIGLLLSATAASRISGLCLNDIGPEINPDALARIAKHVGVKPKARDFAGFADDLEKSQAGFKNIPQDRWLAEAKRLSLHTPNGLELTYDPALKNAVLQSMATPAPDLWSSFIQYAPKVLALIHGLNSDLLTEDTVIKMRTLRPDMIYGGVPDRGHIPFLDEPESLSTLKAFVTALKENA